jgi:signal transduction histidine kinase
VSNGVEGAVIRVDDVTERLRMEDVIIQSEKMLSIGGLAAGMAHEINNPLAAIIQNMQVIKSRLTEKIRKNIDEAVCAGTDLENISGYAERRGILRMIDLSIASAQRAASIVENMLSFSRKEHSGAEPVDLAEIMEKTLELAASDYNLKASYDFRRIRIIREYLQDVPKVTCEKNKIQQVFFNILRNGAQAMFDGEWAAGEGHDPQFTIRIYIKRKMVCVDIEDNGPGMDEDTRRRIFEPFFTTKAVGKGTGLGLSIAYFIVSENHGGLMGVESEKGKGCRITVMFPKGGSGSFMKKSPQPLRFTVNQTDMNS